MERLLLMEAKNYDDTLPEIRRTAVRGIIFSQGKLLFVEDKFGALKLPGGGQEEGEDDIATLIREVREETGCTVLPESIRPFGYIEEKRRSVRADEDMIWHQFNRLYFCEVTDERGETEFSQNEKRYGMRFSPHTLEEALAANRKVLNTEGELAWNQREYRTLELIREHLKKA